MNFLGLVKVMAPAGALSLALCGASLQKKDAMEILDHSYQFRSEFQADCSVQVDIALQTALAEKGVDMADWLAYKEQNEKVVSEMDKEARKKYCQ